MKRIHELDVAMLPRLPNEPPTGEAGRMRGRRYEAWKAIARELPSDGNHELVVRQRLGHALTAAHLDEPRAEWPRMSLDDALDELDKLALSCAGLAIVRGRLTIA
jgi:hypothetical protein